MKLNRVGVGFMIKRKKKRNIFEEAAERDIKPIKGKVGRRT